MIKEGVLEGVDAAMACHLWSPLSSGELGLSTGAVMGGLLEFVLSLKGRGGHTAAPHEARDPIMGAASIIKETQLIQSREIDPLQPVVIVFGSIHGGTSSNIIPEEVRLEGTIRYLGDDTLKNTVEERFLHILSSVSTSQGLEYDLSYVASSPPLYNHPEMVQILLSQAQGVIEDNKILEVRSLAGEDFAEFSSRVPALFYFLGCGDRSKGTTYPHHHPCFTIDEDVLLRGVTLHVLSALKYLNP